MKRTMVNPALHSLPNSAFVRLRQLLDHIPPPKGTEPIIMSIGEPQLAPPPMVGEIVGAYAHLWNKYPPNDGSLDFRTACSSWLHRRFLLPEGSIDPTKHVVSASGSREALYLFAQTIIPTHINGERPVVLMPNPYYQVYRAAAAFANADTVLLPASATTNYLPDFNSIDPEILDRTSLAILCTPSNPEGAAADLDYLKSVIKLARQHNFILACDECYTDLYFKAPPPSALNAALALASTTEDPFANVVTFHSLSKRSSVPSLRSGFTAGDETAIDHFRKLRAYASVAMPVPLQMASIALWNDDKHAAENRAHYAKLIEVADQVFADFTGYRRPDGGFFLWLNVNDGEAIAKELWKRGGIRVVPGRYLTADDPNADNGNLGHQYIRIALVHDVETVTTALKLIHHILTT